MSGWLLPPSRQNKCSNVLFSKLRICWHFRLCCNFIFLQVQFSVLCCCAYGPKTAQKRSCCSLKDHFQWQTEQNFILADPATFLVSNSVLGPYCPLRTACSCVHAAAVVSVMKQQSTACLLSAYIICFSISCIFFMCHEQNMARKHSQFIN